MANVIKPKRSSVSGNVPTTTNLVSGELGVNMADQKIWINNGTNVVQIGAGKLATLADVSVTSLTSGQVLQWNGSSWVNSSAGTGTVTSVTGNAPILVATSTSTPVISISAATASAAGSMSATDKAKLDGIASGATANTGTVTSVGGTGAVSGLTLTGTVTTSGNLTLGGTLAVTASNFASQTANTVLAAPNGAAGVPTFRALVAADIPTLNQNTTGSSGSCTGNAATATSATTATTATNQSGGTVNATTGTFSSTLNYTNQLSLNTKVNHYGAEGTATNGQNRLAARLYSLGSKIYLDETFAYSSNSISVYDNAASGQIAITRIASTGLNAPNNSGYVLQVQHIGSSQSPGYGGFYFATGTRANATLACVFRAKLPSGYSLNFASNATGTGGTSYWATDNIGTGKWEDYVYVVRCGDSGSFSSTMFFYVYGSPAPTAGTPLTWYISSATVYDVDNRDNLNTNGYQALTTGNYNSYSPTLTGTGASGTWGISITGSSASCTGNAATATSAVNAAITNDSTTATAQYVTFTSASSGNAGVKTHSTGLTFVPSTGAFTASGNVTAYSDETLKTDWELLPDNFVKMLAEVKSGTYTRKDTGERQVGCSAQSLLGVIKEAVTSNDDGILSVAYGNAALASAVELAKEVVDLKEQVAKLTALCESLAQKLTS